jgi:hypothetical protein
LTVVVGACAFAWAPAALAAGGDAAITGTVVNGTTGDPVPDLEVTLHMLTQQAELGAVSATTDADGAFSFAEPAAGTEGYQVTATFDDVGYKSPSVAYTPGQPATAELKVYETTADPADVVVSTWVVWVDHEGDGAAIQHTLEWNNGGDTAYIGDQTSPDGSPIVTQVSLEPGAANPQFLGIYLDTPGQIRGSTYVNPAPLVPGTSSATLRYTVPNLTSLTLPITLSTSNLQLYVPVGVTVTSSALAGAGQITEKGVDYQVFTAAGLQTGDTIDVSLEGVGGGSSGGNSPLVLVIVGLVVAAAVIGGIVVWRMTRRTPPRKGGRPAASAKGRQPAAGKNGQGGRAPQRTAPVKAQSADVSSASDVDEQFDLLIDEIAALDLAYEKGVLEKKSYETLRAAAKERLLRLREAQTGGRSSR